MDQLPIELCQTIFSLAANYPTTLRSTDLPSEQDQNLASMVYRLAAVSRHWRGIAHQTPELWTHIVACYPQEKDDPTLERVQVHLRRSGSVPLFIDLFFPHDTEVDVIDELFDWVSQHASRWRQCRIEVPDSIAREKLLDVVQRPFPLLEELILVPQSGRAADVIELWDPQNLFFSDAPRLTRLESHVLCMVPVQRLSALQTLKISLRDIVDDPLWLTLAMTPSLEELYCYYPAYGRASSLLEDEIDLPRLHTLGVFGFPGNVDSIAKLRMPALRTLVASIEPCDSHRYSRLFQLLRGHIAHLVLTTVDDSGYLCRGDAVTVEKLAGIESLELRGLGRDELYDRSFFEHICSSEPWPLLRRLIIRNCSFRLECCRPLVQLERMRREVCGLPQGQEFEIVTENFTVLERDNEDDHLWWEAYGATVLPGTAITPSQQDDS